MSKQVLLEDLPLRPFHVGVAFSGTGGQFSDGFVLGIIGIAVSMAAGPMHLDALWMGLLGAASLAGLFFGSMFAGPIADRYGRRTIFAWDMLLFALVSAAQYFVTSPAQLLVLRLVLGLILGADYVVSKSLVTEYSPRRYRGRLLSVLAAAWAAGYVGAYLAGFAMRDTGPDAWRIMLAASGVPALLILPFRLLVPESPMWLMKRGRGDEALAIVRRRFGPEVTLAMTKAAVPQQTTRAWSQLFSPRWRKNTLVGCVFYTCQVIPYFALGTFAPKVLEALHVKDKFVGGLVYNILLLAGAVIGLLLIDRISRRTFLIGTFYLAALGLAVLTYANFGPIGTMLVFGLFACILSAAANLEFVYPPELFPTHLRASGVGLAVASSRFGSAISTFLLPIAVQQAGIHAALSVCVAVLVFGGVFCHFMAPETGSEHLADVKSDGAPEDLAHAAGHHDATLAISASNGRTTRP
ncbi:MULTISPECIES: MFS transporter [unclassified Burkholderia]|uniref:MFS transporter n=1 Tax=unclassified Burkholderia TaxID=2613784 RepID=UPI000F5714D8|nr:MULTISPECIES: MFS transporter [unclassified Burkholderia]RQR46293.1 MFS transporter [Burkholderia sp. Bp9131]RQR78547.1 MFS transporter [Burkholderia sp. Bp9015]RQR81699.1 MFS transporter [Burkholderia sp. Bp9011]RQR91398.1 MFS transporter [Burkholderia sp. Bp9010]RQS18058.1 MFS transporter [Burkholderia sp. Bp8995]